jgi:hypothetical protein
MNSIDEILAQELRALTVACRVPRARRVYHQHRFDPRTRICRDCTVSEKEHHNVPYGAGVPCRLAEQVTR